MSKFKVGDRVRVKNNGRLGTVIDVHTSPGQVVAEMDGPNVEVEVSQFPGRKVYWLGEDSYEKVAGNAKIVITHDGTTTLARMFEGNKVVKSAEAKCSPHDTFDFAVGANLAYDRLMDRLAATPPIEKGPSGIDWNAFLRGEVLVECTENNRSAFIEELACKFPALFWGAGAYPLKDYEPRENNFHIIDGGLFHNNGLHGFRGSKNIKQRVTYQPAEKPQDNGEERRALADKICAMGMCSANNSARKNSCPFYKVEKGALCCTEYAAAHPETQKMMEDYLAAEQEVKPERPAKKQEPIKLYCIKDRPHGFNLTKGKIYTFDAESGISDDDGFNEHHFGSYLAFARANPDIAAHLIPLVKRPAKVGEWVYITEGRAKGVIGEVLHIDHAGVPLVRHRDVWGMFSDQNGMELTRFSISQYLVLDGYQPKPECCRCCGQPLKKESTR